MSSFVNLLDVIYPINSIYITNSTTSPASTIGGTWTAVTGAICGNTSNNAKNYGSDTCTLTVSQIPSHNHLPSGCWGWAISKYFNTGQYQIQDNVSSGNTISMESSGYTGGGQAIRPYSAATAAMCGGELPSLVWGEAA